MMVKESKRFPLYLKILRNWSAPMLHDKKPKLADYVIEEIKNMLRRGELQEGGKIPNQHEFAEQLGVSRLSLREALHTLQIFDIVMQKPRIGTIIVNGDPDNWPLPGAHSKDLDKQGIGELLEARKIIELSLLKLAAGRITGEEMSKLDEIVQSMKAAIAAQSCDQYSVLEWRFHKTLAVASKNRYLLSMYLYGGRQIADVMSQVHKRFPQSVKKALAQHQTMYRYLESGDQKALLTALEKHLDEISIYVVRYYA
jgi:GntR family transcriptional repressor for pyruvate dehydrogenase complex